MRDFGPDDLALVRPDGTATESGPGHDEHLGRFRPRSQTWSGPTRGPVRSGRSPGCGPTARPSRSAVPTAGRWRRSPMTGSPCTTSTDSPRGLARGRGRGPRRRAARPAPAARLRPNQRTARQPAPARRQGRGGTRHRPPHRPSQDEGGPAARPGRRRRRTTHAPPGRPGTGGPRRAAAGALQPGYDQLLDILVSIAAQPPIAAEPSGLAGRPAAAVVAGLIRRPWRRLKRAGWV